MSEERKPRRTEPANPWLIGVCIWYVLLACAGVGILMLPDLAERTGWMLFVVTLAAAPIGILVARSAGSSGGSLEQNVREMTRSISTMTQEQGLSEVAKSVLHRRQEREILRRAIEQDIADEDWDAAMVLVKELAERFGYRADAEEFRSRIERARLQTMDRNVVESLVQLDDLIRHAQWPESYAEAARIQRLYPESHRVHGLRERVDEARQRYRKELERSFLLSAEKGLIDEAMAFLEELDHYLTPTEAAPLQEVARGVIGKARDNLGVQFKLRMQDHHWDDAIAIGEQIVQRFPNSRMAQEVRDIMPTLRERSGTLAQG